MSEQETSDMGKDREDDNKRDEHGVEGDLPTRSLPDSLGGIGTEVGSYKLLSVLGEGGIGIVYRAEQKHPVRRQVALAGRNYKNMVANLCF